MAWEDRTPFEAIYFQFDLKEKEVIRVMRSKLKPSSFRAWRKRVSGRKLKHGFTMQKIRFKSANQKWKSNLQRFAQTVEEIFNGEKNGQVIGKKSFTVLKDAEKEKIKSINLFRASHLEKILVSIK